MGRDGADLKQLVHARARTWRETALARGLTRRAIRRARVAVVLNVAVSPLTEPAGVELRARLRPNVTPGDVERILRTQIATPLRGSPRVTLEELDGNSLVVRISATPEHPSDGPRVAAELLSAINAHASATAEEARPHEHHEPAADRP